MKKYNMPTVHDFFGKKFTFGPKPEPVWVYLEREMREKAVEKPYNEKVGEWLKFLKDLKQYTRSEAKFKERRILKEIGPSWYVELSKFQQNTLSYLKEYIQSDLIEDVPRRVRKCLIDLGTTFKLPKSLLMKAMRESNGDPGVFIWNLYTEYYKIPPSELREEYDLNAKILMSSLVFIDLEECMEKLQDLTKAKTSATVVKKKKKVKISAQADATPGSEYFKKTKITLFSNHPEEESLQKKDTVKAPPLEYKVKLRSDKSYAMIRNDSNFLDSRKARNKKEKDIERSCQYKFWEPPGTLRNTDPKMAAYVNKLKMIKLRPKAKFKAPFDTVQYNIGNVAFAGGRPRYVLNSIAILPSGYIPINGGIVHIHGEMVMQVNGYWKYPRDSKDSCDADCTCMDKWGDSVTKYLEKSKCTCGHRYDLYHVGKAKEKCFHPSTRHGKFWFDNAKIFQLDPREDFIKDTIKDALLSGDVTPEPSEPSIAPSGLKPKALLEAFLSELTETSLIIPHLPEANLLNNLQEWVRNRVKGPVSEAHKKKMLLKSQRRWLDLKHMKFAVNPSRIPFTARDLEHMSWDHRNMVQKLFNLLLDEFLTRNQLSFLRQTQMWWSTMNQDGVATKGFSDIFFTYMPARAKDIYLMNPYNSVLTPKYGAKTCPLGR